MIFFNTPTSDLETEGKAKGSHNVIDHASIFNTFICTKFMHRLSR